MGRHDRADRRVAGRRPAAGGAAPAPCRVQRGDRMVGVLHRASPSRSACGSPWPTAADFGTAVLRGLHRREEPVGRQPLRLRDHHGDVRGARGASAQGADVRHHPGADHARDLHRARRGAAVAVLVHVPDLRAAADLHRRPAVPAPRRGPRRREQHHGARDAPAPAGHRHYDGGKLFTRVDGRRMVTPLLAVLIAIGSVDLLFALDSIPAVFGVTERAVHRVRRQRVRAAGSARAVLPRQGAAGPAGVPVDGALDHPGVHRRQAGAALGPRGHRPARPRGRHLPEPGR